MEEYTSTESKCLICDREVKNNDLKVRNKDVEQTFWNYWTKTDWGDPGEIFEESAFCQVCETKMMTVHKKHKKIERILAQIRQIMIKMLAKAVSASKKFNVSEYQSEETLEAKSRLSFRRTIFNSESKCREKDDFVINISCNRSGFSPTVVMAKLGPEYCRSKGTDESAFTVGAAADEDELKEFLEITADEDYLKQVNEGSCKEEEESIDISEEGRSEHSFAENQASSDLDFTVDKSPSGSESSDSELSSSDEESDVAASEEITVSAEATPKRVRMIEITLDRFQYGDLYGKKIGDKFECETCEYSTDNRKQLRNHLYFSHRQRRKRSTIEELDAAAPEDNAVLDKDVEDQVLFHRGELQEVTPGKYTYMDKFNFEAVGKDYMCSSCGWIYHHRHEMLRHIRNRHNRIPARLRMTEITPDRFKYGDLYGKKIGDKFVCETCEFSTDNIKQLRNHIYCRHRYKRKPSVVQPKNPQEPVLCEICGQSLSGPHTLRLHMDTHGDNLNYSCKICDNKFRTKYQLYHHMKMKHYGDEKKNFVCSQCPERFWTSADLQAHMRVHTGENQFPCPDCGIALRTQYCLAVHRRTHTRDRDCPCDICGRKFSNSGSLIRHKRLGHKLDIPITTSQRNRKSPPRNFICEVCGKAFWASARLKSHMASHTGEKSFSCPECGKKYASYFALGTHRRKHFDPKTYQCDLCDQTFSYQASVYRHKRRVHKIDSCND